MKPRLTRFPMFGLPLLVIVAMAAGLFSVTDGTPHRPRVVLDAGHGADELGATGYGIIERDSNLDMAKRVGAFFKDAGVDVIYTRSDDGRSYDDDRDLTDYSATFADLEERIAIANEAKADLFVSIHSNSFYDPSARGIEIYYNADRAFAERNRELAESIRAGLVAALEDHGYGVQPSTIREDTSITDAAGRNTPYFVLGPERPMPRAEMDDRGGDWDALGYGKQSVIQTRETDMPGVLLELFYVSSEEDAALLKDDSARYYMAQGIALGIQRVLNNR